MPKSKAPVREVPVTPTEETAPVPVVVPNLPEDPNHPSRWKHRRRLAYIAMISILLVTVYVLGPWMPLERVEKVSDIVEWFYFSMASVVGAYMGFATWAARTH